MRIIKNILIVLYITLAWAQHFEGNIGLIGQLPKGEFKDVGVTTGFGLDLNFSYHPVDNLGFGINLGGSVYDISTREIPFSYYSDLITITEETKNGIFHGHLFFKINPLKGRINPYVEGLIGFKNLQTNTRLYNQNCTDNSDTEWDDCEIASSTNASDIALSYGCGFGLEVFLTTFEKDPNSSEGKLFFFINGRFLWGGEAEYLKEGDIEFSNPEDGPVQTTFNWNKSKTDLLQISIGVSVLI